MDEKKEYETLKELNDRLKNFNDDGKKNAKEKDDEEER